MYPNGADFALSLTFDVEMCTNFPYWTSQWNHRKGAIDEDSKLYMGKMLDVAEKYGVKLQFFWWAARWKTRISIISSAWRRKATRWTTTRTTT